MVSRGRRCEVTSRAWYNPNLETRWNMIPALIGTLTMLQTLLLTAMSVAREREQGTFDQLLVTPFRPVEIMAGKAMPVDAHRHDPGDARFCWWRSSGSAFRSRARSSTLYAGRRLFLLAAVGIGLLVSSVATTMQQAMLYSLRADDAFHAAVGPAAPISNMPPILQYLTLVNPLRYRHRHRASRLSRGHRPRPARPRSFAARDHRADHFERRCLDVPPWNSNRPIE